MKKCKLFILSSKYEGHSNVLVHSQILNNKILAHMHMVQIKKSYKIMEIYFQVKIQMILQSRQEIFLKKEKINSEKYLYNRFNDQNVALKFSKLF